MSLRLNILNISDRSIRYLEVKGRQNGVFYLPLFTTIQYINFVAYRHSDVIVLYYKINNSTETMVVRFSRIIGRRTFHKQLFFVTNTLFLV